MKIIRVPMSTFPPTAIVYSVNKTEPTEAADDDNIPVSVMARVLAKPETDPSHKSGRVVICRRCLVDRTIAECFTQTDDIAVDSPSLCRQNHTLNNITAVRNGSKSITCQPSITMPILQSVETQI